MRKYTSPKNEAKDTKSRNTCRFENVSFVVERCIIGSSGFAQDNIIVSMSVILVGIVTAMILKKYGLFH